MRLKSIGPSSNIHSPGDEGRDAILRGKTSMPERKNK